MLNVIMLSFVMLSIAMLNAVKLSVIWGLFLARQVVYHSSGALRLGFHKLYIRIKIIGTKKVLAYFFLVHTMTKSFIKVAK
jgi:hypothetical protein